jgi:CubicO group peptidase (beta-lactamase class C family)/D-alanyl-D-alanine dipeptidase
MMLLRVLLLLCCLPLAAFSQDPARYASAIQEIGKLVEFEREENGIPAMSIAIVEGDRLLYEKGFGSLARRNNNRSATAETIYRVGSVSKLFTDIAIMQLVEEGKIDLDKPVSTYLPEFKPDNKSGKEITLRQLMSHRSGLIREPRLGSYFDPDPPSLQKTVESLNGVPLTYEPGAKIKYSNAAIAVVGRVVEKVDGRPFPQAVRERVLKPLGMTASDFEPTAAVKKNLAEAEMWSYHGKRFTAPTFELGESPAGCMYSNVQDLARFMKVVLAGGKEASPLKPDTLKQMLTPQFADKDAKNGFGIGFALNQLEGKLRVGHGGAIYGFSTELAMLPEEKLGVVVIASKDVTNQITTRIVDEALKMLLATKKGQAFPKEKRPEPLPLERVRALAGKYGSPEAPFQLLDVGGKLYILGPIGGFLAEVRMVGDELISHGILGSGTRFKCDGKKLEIGKKSHARIETPSGPPPGAPEHFKGLIGEYGWPHNVLYIMEMNGQLYALIEWFFFYPLKEESKDVYAFPTEGGLYHGEKLVFHRDAKGKATGVDAANVYFKRRVLDGEDGQTFRIKPLKGMAELRKMAAEGKPPVEKKERAQELVLLDPIIKTELRYATDNNFMGTALYPKSAKAYMQKPAADAVKRAHEFLEKQGFGLLVYDPYRPWSVTKMFWEATPTDLRNFVANPARGSKHNRGCAVDLTIFDQKTGKAVEMPSGYDEFSDRSFPNYWGGTSRQRWFRQLLRHTMEATGFTVDPGEWWHFDYKDWAKYSIGNQGFDELAK